MLEGLNTHTQSVHEIVVNCNEGGKEFYQECPLNGHVETVHEEKKPFNCNDCGKAFS